MGSSASAVCTLDYPFTVNVMVELQVEYLCLQMEGVESETVFRAVKVMVVNAATPEMSTVAMFQFRNHRHSAGDRGTTAEIEADARPLT